MWRLLIVTLILMRSALLGQIGVPAFASPIYELVCFDGNLDRQNSTLVAFCVERFTGVSERIYVCVQEKGNSWRMVFFRFLARQDETSRFLLKKHYNLIEEHSVKLSPKVAGSLTVLLKGLATPEKLRSGLCPDARRWLTVSHFIAGGVTYPESEVSRYMPLFDGICDGLQRGDTQKMVEEKMEIFFNGLR